MRAALGLPPREDDSWKDRPLTPSMKATLIQMYREVRDNEMRLRTFGQRHHFYR